MRIPKNAVMLPEDTFNTIEFLPSRLSQDERDQLRRALDYEDEKDRRPSSISMLVQLPALVIHPTDVPLLVREAMENKYQQSVSVGWQSWDAYGRLVEEGTAE